MIKKLFFGFMLLAGPLFAAETARVGMSANPNAARPSSAARALTLPGGTMVSQSSGKTSTTGSVDTRCANPLPDQLTTSRCMQKYMACLKQDSVCGEHFESCDTVNKFNQKRILCQEKLLECPDEGISALYGVKVTSRSTPGKCDGEQKIIQRDFSPALSSLTFAYNKNNPDQTNPIAQAMYDGVTWVASNAVSACKSAINGCIKRACQNSAHKCLTGGSLVDGTSLAASLAALDLTSGGTGPGGAMTAADLIALVNSSVAASVGVPVSASVPVDPAIAAEYINHMAFSTEQARNYIRQTCENDIGTNKACYMFANGGKAPTNDFWQSDNFEVSSTYNTVLADFNALSANEPNIMEWLAADISKAIGNCTSSATDCVKSACGSGSLAACYGSAVQADKSIKIELTDFSARCGGTVRANQNCKNLYDEADFDTDDEAWDRVWGNWTTGTPPTFTAGDFELHAKLDNELSGMFNEVAVRNTFLQCRSEAESCVRRECGSDFMTCYINDDTLVLANGQADYGQVVRDADGNIIATGNAAGGFDSTMARSLCLMPVKRSQTCQTFFDIEYARSSTVDYSWAGAWNSMATSYEGTGWAANPVLSNVGTVGTRTTEICSATKTYTFTETGGATSYDPVTGTYDFTGATETMTSANSQCAQLEGRIFGELIADVAGTARAQITQEQKKAQTSCKQKGGSWATKPAGALPANYASNGLAAPAVETPNLWNAFCQMRVSLQAADKSVGGAGARLNQLFQAGINGTVAGHTVMTNTSAYFSLGDAISCGSWIAQSDLDWIESQIRGEAADKEESERGWWQSGKNAAILAAVGGAVAGGVGGAIGGGMLGSKIGESMDKKKASEKDIKAAQSKLASFKKDVEAEKKKVEAAGNNSPDVQSKVKERDGIQKALDATEAMDAATPVDDALKLTLANASGFATGSVELGKLNDAMTSARELATVKSALNGLLAELNGEIENINKNLRFEKKSYKTHDGLKGVVDRIELFQYTAKPNAETTYEEAMDDFAKLEKAIKDIEGAKGSDAQDKGKLWGSVAGGVLGAGALGTGAYFLTQSAIDRKNELDELKAGDKAVQDWFDNVGSKIQCIVNGRVVGSYGDIIELK